MKSSRERRATTPRIAVLVTLVLGSLTVAVPGLALFTAMTSQPSATVSSATLAPATGLGLAHGLCVPAVSTQVNVTWTATTSTFADGYEIARATVSGGPYTTIGSVEGWGTVTFVDNTPAFATTYYYVVRAKKLAWRSVNTAQQSVTTQSTLCL